MKKDLLLFLFSLCFSATFAQWNTFNTNQKSYFKINDFSSAPTDTTYHQFHYDTIIDYGTFQVLHSNYTNPAFNGCYDVVNQNFGSYSFISSKQYVRPDSVLLVNDSATFFYENTSVLFLPKSGVGQTWLSPINNSSNYNTLQFTCDSLVYGNYLLNNNDSLKCFSVKAFQNLTPVASAYDNVHLILSRVHGFKQLIVFNDNNQHEIKLVGLDSANTKTGFSYPDFSKYFHLSVGDVIIWKEATTTGFFFPPTIVYHKDSVINTLITPDSVVYNFNRVSTGGGNTSTYTMRYLKTNFTGLKATSSVYTVGKKVFPENFGFSNSELFETFGSFITNDTVVNRYYSFIGFSIDTSNCIASLITDVGYNVTYNTYSGLSSYYLFAGETEILFTIEGSTINGVQIGANWNTILTSVDENEVDKLIQLYPNPSNDGNITIKHSNVNSIAVYSIDGKLILTKQLKNNDSQTNLTLPKGIYFIHFEENNSKRSVSKVIVTG